MIIKPGRDIQLNRAHPLARGLMGCWLFNEGTGDKVFDLSLNGNHGTLIGMPWRATSTGIGADNNSDGDEIDIGGLTIPANSDMTFLIIGYADSYISVGNSGFWRDVSNSRGGNFMIIQGGSSPPFLPWIRWNGIDILKPASGTPFPTGEVFMGVYTVKNAKDAIVYLNGRQEHYATHSTSTPSFDIYNLGWQSDPVERIDGVWITSMIWNRALTASEVLQLYRNPYQMFDPRISPAIFGALVAAGGLSIPIAMRYYRNRRTI